MRIISGLHKSRLISTPSGNKVRPTSDRAKETLFNILNNQIDFSGITCFDLFCGTGSLGLECISRGAQICIFVDEDTKLVNKNIIDLKVEHSSEVIKEDVIKFLSYNKLSPDIVFCDPPYEFERYDLLIQKISLLKTLLVLEHSKNFLTPVKFGDSKFLTRKVGTVNFTFFNFN